MAILRSGRWTPYDLSDLAEQALIDVGMVCIRCGYALGPDVDVLIGEGLAHMRCPD